MANKFKIKLYRNEVDVVLKALEITKEAQEKLLNSTLSEAPKYQAERIISIIEDIELELNYKMRHND